jgi:hypothetical protein
MTKIKLKKEFVILRPKAEESRGNSSVHGILRYAQDDDKIILNFCIVIFHFYFYILN